MVIAEKLLAPFCLFLLVVGIYILCEVDIAAKSIQFIPTKLLNNVRTSARVQQKNENLVALLRRKVRVLCWVMTSPKTIQTKARVISQTWGPHCDVTLYISSASNSNPPATVVNVPEGREHLTKKTRAAFKLIYDKYRNQADWFVKTDDDTFLIVENLRYLLAHYNTNQPLHFGHQFYSGNKESKFKTGESWNSGGAGYVLSKAALRVLATRGLSNRRLCPHSFSEDFYIGRCLENLHVVQGISADREGRPSFLALSPGGILDGGKVPEWYKRYSVHYVDQGGMNCCSPYVITFHYVSPEIMRLLYYFVYKIKVYGLPEQAHNTNLHDSIFADPDIPPQVRDLHELPNYVTDKPENKTDEKRFSA